MNMITSLANWSIDFLLEKSEPLHNSRALVHIGTSYNINNCQQSGLVHSRVCDPIPMLPLKLYKKVHAVDKKIAKCQLTMKTIDNL